MRALAACAASLVTLVAVVPAAGYDHFAATVDGQRRPLSWPRLPLTYIVDHRGGAGISGSELAAASQRAFAAWTGLPDAGLSAAFAGFGPLGSRALAPVSIAFGRLTGGYVGYAYLSANTRGEVYAADILISDEVVWSAAPQGEPGTRDLNWALAHEVGHVWGLAHSGIAMYEPRPSDGWPVAAGVATTMFPRGFGRGVAYPGLSVDDQVGVSLVYAAEGLAKRTGRIEGGVQQADRPLARAHVVAFHLESGALVGAFTDEGGRFTLSGLAPGPHVLRAEPLEEPWLYAGSSAASFPVTYLERVIFVAAGKAAGGVAIEVAP